MGCLSVRYPVRGGRDSLLIMVKKALKAKGIEPMIEEARKSNEDERRVLVDVGGG